MKVWIKLIIYGLIGETAALLVFFSHLPFQLHLTLFVTVHFLSCLVLATLLSVAFPKSFIIRKRSVFCFFFGISFFIPLLGTIAMLLAFYYFIYVMKEGQRTEFSTVSLPPFMSEAGDPGPGMGEGGAWSRIKAPEVPRQLRLKALLAVSASSGQNASRLLKLASGDRDDEIRLLAFNIYDRREKVIADSISQALHFLRDTSDPLKQRELCRNLAFAYWEVVYNDLARDDLARFFIRQSLMYSLRAKELGADDPALLVLIGRLHLRQGHLEEAEKAITSALEQGVHRDKVIPYLAELAYRRRDFRQVKQYFRTDPLLRHKPGIGPVVQFWAV